MLAVSCAVLALAAGDGPPAPGPACLDCPNIVLLLTDDQDLELGGWEPMNKTRALMSREGATASEWRIHTPICAPSRAELQTGRYYRHVTSTQYTPPPAMHGDGAIAQLDLGGKVWPYTFPQILRKEKGYVTALFGKCMNDGCGRNTEGGTHYNTDPDADFHLMGAFDRWFEHTGYVNGTFFDNQKETCTWPWLSNTSDCKTPTHPGGQWAGKGDGYDTSTIGNMTVQWIKEVSGKGRPFFIYWATHAPHDPYTPAPWYEKGTFCDDVISPRTPNFNYSGYASRGIECTSEPPSGPVHWYNGIEFHEVVSCQPPLSESDVQTIDKTASNRCKALLSVDDSYQGIFDAVAEAGVLDNTYFFVTSDHGYNLGQHRLPTSKLQVYEHTLRIPMTFMGPGIPKGSEVPFLGTQVDLAPTFLGLAGIDTPASMDGRSLVSILLTNTTDPNIPQPARKHMAKYPAFQRTSSFHTFYNQGPWHVGYTHPLDDWSNTFIAIAYNGPLGHYKFGIFDTFGKQNNFSNPYMYEMFDLNTDPYEINNIYNKTLASNPELVRTLKNMTYSWYNCEGSSCM